MIESVEGGALNLREGTAAGEQGLENNAVAVEMSPLARQRIASESSELEEDEEKAQERLPPPLNLPGETHHTHTPYGITPCCMSAGQAAARHAHRRESKVVSELCCCLTGYNMSSIYFYRAIETLFVEDSPGTCILCLIGCMWCCEVLQLS